MIDARQACLSENSRAPRVASGDGKDVDNPFRLFLSLFLLTLVILSQSFFLSFSLSLSLCD